MEALIAFVVALFRVLLPVLKEKSEGSVEDGVVDTDLKASLRSEVLSYLGNKTLPLTILAVMLLFVPGCFTRTIYVPDGTPVRLRETVEDVDVWVLDKDGVPVEGNMDLPEGWYALPVSKETPKNE